MHRKSSYLSHTIKAIEQLCIIHARFYGPSSYIQNGSIKAVPLFLKSILYNIICLLNLLIFLIIFNHPSKYISMYKFTIYIILYLIKGRNIFRIYLTKSNERLYHVKLEYPPYQYWMLVWLIILLITRVSICILSEFNTARPRPVPV